MRDITPSPAIHVAIGGLVCGIIAAPLITNPLDTLAPPNPIGYLLVLLGPPLGGLVYRMRASRCPIDNEARKRRRIAIFATLLIPLLILTLVGTSDRGSAIAAIGLVVAFSLSSSILALGLRRQAKTNIRSDGDQEID